MGLEALAEALLDELCASHPLGYRPKVVWKNLRVSAGQAFYRDGMIGLSRLLLTDEDRLKDTLVHEYAHLLAVVRHGRKAANHGPHWQRAMKDLGAEPTVRHRYEVVRNSRRSEVVYRCERCGASIVKARRLPRRRRYVHRDCGGPIRFAFERLADHNELGS